MAVQGSQIWSFCFLFSQIKFSNFQDRADELSCEPLCIPSQGIVFYDFGSPSIGQDRQTRGPDRGWIRQFIAIFMKHMPNVSQIIIRSVHFPDFFFRSNCGCHYDSFGVHLCAQLHLFFLNNYATIITIIIFRYCPWVIRLIFFSKQ